MSSCKFYSIGELGYVTEFKMHTLRGNFSYTGLRYLSRKATMELAAMKSMMHMKIIPTRDLTFGFSSRRWAGPIRVHETKIESLGR